MSTRTWPEAGVVSGTSRICTAVGPAKALISAARMALLLPLVVRGSVLWTVGFREDLVCRLGPHEWVASVVPAVDEQTDLGGEVASDAKVPRWMACLSMIPNQASTRFSQDPEVGVKCTWIRGLAASHWRTSTRLWVA